MSPAERVVFYLTVVLVWVAFLIFLVHRVSL